MLILQLLRYDPEQRLPLPDVLRHPWIRKYTKRSSKTGGSKASHAPAARES
jgi:aurora kinase